MVCPLMGGAGTKLRLFEALACGLPVVGSKFLFEGVDEVFTDQVAYEAEDVDGYCAHIATLAADRNLRIAYRPTRTKTRGNTLFLAGDR